MRTRYVDGFRRRPLLAIGFSAIAFAFVAVLLLQGPTFIQDAGPLTPTAHAASKQVAADPTGVIDGAKNPERIPDDQAYHLVLMVASAADDAPEVEKERAKAVRAMILSGLPTDTDVPELAELANGHRKVLTTLAKEAAAGNADAARLKAEHLSRVKAEADLRLPAGARAALAAYVKAEKANMEIHGKPDQQVVAMPELLKPGTMVRALGYCDGGSSGLAPYCRDGCSGARPCDKRCRRDDESCTTCGEYGVCCCLGGGGGGTPTPTPTPAPSSPMSTSEPTGTIYRNIALDDNLVFYVTAITDTAESCSCHSSSAGARIYAPWGSSSASSGMTGAYAQATARYQMSEAEFAVEQNVVVDTDHTSFCPIRGITFLAVNPRSLTPKKASDTKPACIQPPL